MTQQRRRYPSEQQIERMVAVGKKLGLDVAGFEVSADGSIRIIEARAVTAPSAAPASAFDRFADQL
jgi:hypothetical protein